MWKKLDKLVKESRHHAIDEFYTIKQMYKDIDIIYESNKKVTVDILCEMALDVNLPSKWDNNSVMCILYYLLLMHESDDDSVDYLKHKYSGLLESVFKDESYVKNRKFLDGLTDIGFNENEELSLFKNI